MWTWDSPIFCEKVIDAQDVGLENIFRNFYGKKKVVNFFGSFLYFLWMWY